MTTGMRKDRVSVWKIPNRRYGWLMLCPCCGFVRSEMFFQATLKMAVGHVDSDHKGP